MDLLLFLYHFIKSFELFSLVYRPSNARMHLVDVIDAFIEALSLALDVLFLPVLGPLLAHLQLDFERVE